MNSRYVIWSLKVKSKLIQFRRTRYTPAETFDYISQIVIEPEDLLKNENIGRMYTEELGKYKGISKIKVRKFRIYFEQIHNNIVIVAILFPGGNK